MTERRRRARTAPDAVVEVRRRPGGEPLGRIINLSRHGFLTLGPAAVTPHQRLALWLELGPGEGEPIALVAEAVWCRPSTHSSEYGAGFRICEIDEADAERIERAVGG
ncbi:PilZ domain-containing protein [Spiribacter halobius]|uniref:PilZ domain-containing protein n=1 Tax=Sediminicurvatus halobius TaxID=2182432 RepID=A0A2U2MYN1_9GAMM|nr:PilZ domain-containing protein [Spiribacter halobius]PWG62046.1 hypothetical protein DEM34_13780 [Spiribacter halobius]UEX78689.1 PilZ domain-containing protein [Spiribacter halobius]